MLDAEETTYQLARGMAFAEAVAVAVALECDSPGYLTIASSADLTTASSADLTAPGSADLTAI